MYQINALNPKQEGHQARKRFGQNFLHDQRVIAKIVRSVNPRAGENIVEIGPGLAALTSPLIGECDALTVLELDRDLAAGLPGRVPHPERLTIIETDALKYDFTQLFQEGRPLRVVGNLPYNISTPLLFCLSEVVDEVVDMHFMLQKEVVERMVAEPKTNDYGRLSVMLQYFFEMELLIEVPPESFEPAPKVNSAVVRMIPNAGRIGVAHDYKHFAKLVKTAFHQRRKTIRNNLKDLANDDDLTAVGINPQDRAEHIEATQYVVLSNYLLQQAT